MRNIKGFKRYKSLFDECLYKPLPVLNGNNNYEIQIRQTDSTTHFSVYYCDGYSYQRPRYVQGWSKLKEIIKEIEDYHNDLLISY